MEQKTFTTTKNLTVRVKETPALEMMAICDAAVSLFNTDGKFNLTSSSNIDALRAFYTVASEHIEVKVGDQWLPLKEKDRDVWWPAEIASDFKHLREIMMWFLSDVAIDTFISSNE